MHMLSRGEKFNRKKEINNNDYERIDFCVRYTSGCIRVEDARKS